MKYYQCDLSQGITKTTAYIEERGAKLGSKVEIKEPGFSGFWNVDAVGSHGIEESTLREKQRVNRHFNQDI